GLGKALVDKLIASDANVVVGVSRSAKEAKPNFVPVALDLADTEALIQNVDKIFPAEAFQEIYLINNAGWIGEITALGKLQPHGIRDIQAINVIAPAILINEFVRRYGDNKAKKVVVNISSGAAGKAIDGWSGYWCSRATINQLCIVREGESMIKNLANKYDAV